MERNAVVEYLASLTDEERENVVGEAAQRAHPWHRREYNGRIVCARLVGDTYLLAKTDDPTKAEAIHAIDQWRGNDWWVEASTSKID